MSLAFERAQISEDCNSHFNNVTQNTPYPVCHNSECDVRDKKQTSDANADVKVLQM